MNALPFDVDAYIVGEVYISRKTSESKIHLQKACQISSWIWKQPNIQKNVVANKSLLQRCSRIHRRANLMSCFINYQIIVVHFPLNYTLQRVSESEFKVQIA